MLSLNNIQIKQLDGFILFQIKIVVKSYVQMKVWTVQLIATGCQTIVLQGTVALTLRAVNVFQGHAQNQTALMVNMLE
jgi:hypothetical protein